MKDMKVPIMKNNKVINTLLISKTRNNCITKTKMMLKVKKKNDTYKTFNDVDIVIFLVYYVANRKS